MTAVNCDRVQNNVTRSHFTTSELSILLPGDWREYPQKVLPVCCGAVKCDILGLVQKSLPGGCTERAPQARALSPCTTGKVVEPYYRVLRVRFFCPGKPHKQLALKSKNVDRSKPFGQGCRRPLATDCGDIPDPHCGGRPAGACPTPRR